VNLFHKYVEGLPELKYEEIRDSFVEADPNVLLVAHCLVMVVVVDKYTQGKHGFLKSIVLGFVMSFGGAIINAILTATPSPVSTEGANSLVPIFLLCWWLVNCTPVKKILQIKVVLAPIAVVATFARVWSPKISKQTFAQANTKGALWCWQIRAISMTVDSVAKQVPDGWVAAILLGGIGGCGGLLFLDADRKFRTGFNAKSTFSSPEWPIKSAFLTSTAYYVLSDPHNIIQSYVDFPHLQNADLRFALGTFLSIISIAEMILGRSINLFHYFERILVAVLGLQIDKPRQKASINTAKSKQKTQ